MSGVGAFPRSLTNEGEKMLKHMRGLLAACSLGLMASLPATAWSLPYSSMVVFGDSLADSGNNALVLDQLAGGVRTPTPLAGPAIPSFPYASNRYSNGPVWVEYLASSLGLSAQPSLAGGTNFAFGGARTGPAGSGFPYSLTDQVGGFLQATGGSAPGQALYVVEGGGNDARDVLTTLLSGGDPTAQIQAYADNMALIVKLLALAGADQFLLWNIPDIGYIPAIRAMGPTATAVASLYTGLMNQALVQALGGLAPSIADGIHLFDAYAALQDIATNPAAFGFADANNACAADPLCVANPSGYFFWDGIHPTTAGHQLMASLALVELPEPGSAVLVALGLFGLLVSVRRVR